MLVQCSWEQYWHHSLEVRSVSIQGGGGSGPEGDCQVFHPDTFVAYIEFNQLSTALAGKKSETLTEVQEEYKIQQGSVIFCLNVSFSSVAFDLYMCLCLLFHESFYSIVFATLA